MHKVEMHTSLISNHTQYLQSVSASSFANNSEYAYAINNTVRQYTTRIWSFASWH